MPRPRCCRKIGCMPDVQYFLPLGMVPGEGDDIVLTLDELESLRLADFDGLYQGDAANRMGVSRQTFGRIVETARKKVTDALVHGKGLRIEGGDVTFDTTARKKCPHCEQARSVGQGKRLGPCPRCDKHCSVRKLNSNKEESA